MDVRASSLETLSSASEYQHSIFRSSLLRVCSGEKYAVCCRLKDTLFFPFSMFEVSVLEVLLLQLLVRLVQLPEVLRSVLRTVSTTSVEAQTFPADIVSWPVVVAGASGPFIVKIIIRELKYFANM